MVSQATLAIWAYLKSEGIILTQEQFDEIDSRVKKHSGYNNNESKDRIQEVCGHTSVKRTNKPYSEDTVDCECRICGKRWEEWG